MRPLYRLLAVSIGFWLLRLLGFRLRVYSVQCQSRWCCAFTNSETLVPKPPNLKSRNPDNS